MLQSENLPHPTKRAVLTFEKTSPRVLKVGGRWSQILMHRGIFDEYSS